MLKKLHKGFTLIELLIVIAIMAVLLSFSVADYNSFGRDVELDNDVYVVAVTIREAQVYGINKKARKNQTISFGDKYKYGAFFAKTSENINSLDSSHFIMYIDGFRNNCITEEAKCNDGFTNHGVDNCTKQGEDECYSQILLKRGNKIKSLKVKDNNGAWNDVNKLDISFSRPNPDAIIRSGLTAYSGARIVIEDSVGMIERCVEVSVPGSIFVKANCN